MNIVMSAVGKKGLHNQWINGDYDLVLFHYEEQGKNYKDGRITHVFKEGFKFPLIKEYLEKCKKEYDYYLFLDDDIILPSDEIEKIFKIAKKIKAKVFHPAINPINMPSKIMHKNEFTKYRYVDWIEIQSVGMSLETLKTLLPTFDISKSGYGLPNKWNEVLNSQDMFCIIDEVESYHTKKIADPESLLYSKLGSENIMKDYKELVKDIKINKFEEIKVYSKPMLSVCTIFCDEDMQMLTQQFETIPDYAQHVLVRTVPENIEEPYIKSNEKIGNRIWIEYAYPENEFSFSDAMNVSIDNASGFYFMKLDADERLLKHQQAGLYLALEKSLYNETECIAMWTMSCLDNHKQFDITRQARLFKNRPQYRFKGYAHEHINVPEDFEKYTMDSDFKIDHIGYSISAEQMQKKMIRNVRGMLKSSDILLKHEKYFNLLLRDCSALYAINDFIEKEGK
jgi:glycosyltransferase involved in cell wall biosynthesis